MSDKSLDSHCNAECAGVMAGYKITGQQLFLPPKLEDFPRGYSETRVVDKIVNTSLTLIDWQFTVFVWSRML